MNDEPTQLEADQQEALHIFGPTAPKDYDILKAQYCLSQLLSDRARSELRGANERQSSLQQQAASHARRADEAETKLARLIANPTTMPSPESITCRLLAGEITPAVANAALYALQVAATAQRNAHLIAAARQKEKRLRSPKSRTPKKKSRPRNARK